MTRTTRVVGAGLAALLAVTTAACSGDSVAEQAKAGDGKGYVAGDGTITKIAEAERKGSVTLAGETLGEEQWDVADHRGSVVVVNLWASWCGPCEKEAPDLVAAYETYEPKGVEFVGIDYREPSIDTGRAQSKAWGLPYDSVFDQSGQSAIQMQGRLSAQPSTAVLDDEGRVAAVVLGPVTEATLGTMIDDVLAESS